MGMFLAIPLLLLVGVIAYYIWKATASTSKEKTGESDTTRRHV